MIDFDIVLEKVGTFGGYQILFYVSICYYGIPSGLNSLASVFLNYGPEYRCHMTELENSTLYPNLTDEALLNMTTPLDDNGDPVDACVRYGYDTSECNGTDLSCVNMSSSTVPCDQGYSYDRSLFTETVVTEFDLVCDEKILNTVASAMYMFGFFVGAILFGNAADRFGRKPTLIFCTTGLFLAMLGTAFSHMVELFIVARFFVAMFGMGANVSIFVHILEIVGAKWRTFIGIGYQVSFALGYMLWSGLAYGWRDWHQMQIAALIISLPFGVIAVIAPESPRWLFTTGQEKKGKEVSKLMARLNKVKLDETIWSQAEKSTMQDEDDVKYSTVDMFKHTGMRWLTLKVGFNWAVNSMVYYGISLNAGSLAGDIFINNLLAGVLEIASYILCILTMDLIGRRLLLTLTLTGAGFALLASTIVNEYAGDTESLITLGVVFAFIGKALVSGSFAIIYNFTGELYPTVVRSNGIGFGSMCARVGSILSPFIIGLQDYISWLPNSIFGVFAVVGGLLSLTFRDTTGYPMMETIDEAERFYAGKSKKMYHEEHLDTLPGENAYANEIDLGDEKEYSTNF